MFAKDQDLCQIDLDLNLISLLLYDTEENGCRDPSLGILQAL